MHTLSDHTAVFDFHCLFRRHIFRRHIFKQPKKQIGLLNIVHCSNINSDEAKNNNNNNNNNRKIHYTVNTENHGNCAYCTWAHGSRRLLGSGHRTSSTSQAMSSPARHRGKYPLACRNHPWITVTRMSLQACSIACRRGIVACGWRSGGLWLVNQAWFTNHNQSTLAAKGAIAPCNTLYT